MSYEDDLFQVVDLLASDVSDGEARVNPGDLATGKGFAATSSMWGPDGFLSCPNDPDEDGAAMALLQRDGNTMRVIGTRDNRFSKLAGNLKEGDRAIVTKGAPRFIIKKAKGSVSIATSSDGTTDGYAIYLTLSPDKGLEYSSPWGRMTFGPNGFHVFHSSGARIDLGAIGGLPGPLSALSSYAKVSAGIASLTGGAVSVGTDGGAANDAATTAVFTFVSALVSAIATITTATPGAAAMTPITALLPALQIALGGIGKVV